MLTHAGHKNKKLEISFHMLQKHRLTALWRITVLLFLRFLDLDLNNALHRSLVPRPLPKAESAVRVWACRHRHETSCTVGHIGWPNSIFQKGVQVSLIWITRVGEPFLSDGRISVCIDCNSSTFPIARGEFICMLLP